MFLMHQNPCMECLLYSRCHVVFNISKNQLFLWILLFSSFRGLFDLMIDLQLALFRINTSWCPSRTKNLAWNACYIPGVLSLLKSIMKEKLVTYEKKHLELNFYVFVLEEVGHKVPFIVMVFLHLLIEWPKIKSFFIETIIGSFLSAIKTKICRRTDRLASLSTQKIRKKTRLISII